MEFGIHLLGLGRRGTVADYVTAARAAEEFGYHSVWINDHVVIPTQHASAYPYSADGRPSFTPDDHFYDPFVLLAALASATKTIKLGTSVAVIPYRPPILTAKAIATLDQVSNGRFIFGVGVGWFAEETELLGGSFSERAKVSRAHLETMKALWTEDRPQVVSRSGQSTEVGFAPKPVQKPYPPIWFGGETRAALRRVVQQGDGWFPAFVSPEQFATKASELKQLCAEQGRDFSSLSICAFPANRSYFTQEAIRTYRQHGASVLLAPVANPQVDEFIAQLRTFRDEVMAPARTI
ncbi:MAG: LLM class flavin-dependent oxidoreductase [Candidatus Binatia bacterium]